MVKCLVVDDVEVTRYTTKIILDDMHFAATVCESYPEAMDKLNNDKFDLALIDWHIGKDSGLDIVAHIRKKIGNMPVVVFSGVEDESKANEAIQAGANAFLVKPTTEKKIRDCFENLGFKQHLKLAK